MGLVIEHVEGQKRRHSELTMQHICQNKHQREFFREYIEYQREHKLPNKATSFKRFMTHWQSVGKQIPYSKKYIKERMLVLLKALSEEFGNEVTK